jgi:hypothetical protein
MFIAMVRDVTSHFYFMIASSLSTLRFSMKYFISKKTISGIGGKIFKK